jgi:hypothetical protein
LTNVLTLFRQLIDCSTTNTGERPNLKYLFEQAIVLFEAILFPPKMKNLRFATGTPILNATADASSSHENGEVDDIDGHKTKEQYRIDFASDLCQLSFEFAINDENQSDFAHCLYFFTHLLNASTGSHRHIVAKLSEKYHDKLTIPEHFYQHQARPLIQKAIGNQCALDSIVELTVRTLDTFESSAAVVEGVLADLIQVRSRPSSRLFADLVVLFVVGIVTSFLFLTDIDCLSL